MGDCNCDGLVTVDEILTMVNIALGNADVGICLPGDANGDGLITVDEILTAVNNALNGCPAPAFTPSTTATLTPTAPTTTPTPTPTGTFPTPAPTGQSSLSRHAAGTTIALSQALRAIPALVSSLAPIAAGGGPTAVLGGAAALHNCSGGGTYDLTCTQAVPGTPPRNYSLALNTCTIATTPGATVTLNGALSAVSTETGFLASCSFPPLALSSFTVTDLQITSATAGVTTSSADLQLSGSLSVTPDLSSQCKIAAVDMILNGSAGVHIATVTDTLTFDNTMLRVGVTQFNTDCVPVVYTITLNGSATLSDSGGGGTFSGTFTDFVFTDDTSAGNDVVTVGGGIDSTCFGAAISLQTLTSLSFPPAAVCPTTGAILVTAAGEVDRISYTSGSVEIDRGNDGSVDESFPSCVDPLLLACPAT